MIGKGGFSPGGIWSYPAKTGGIYSGGGICSGGDLILRSIKLYKDVDVGFSFDLEEILYCREIGWCRLHMLI